MNKILRIGTIKERTERGAVVDADIFIKMQFDGVKLSISGVVGPTRGGNCYGSCGQIVGSFKEYDDRGYLTIRDIKPAPDWNYSMIKYLFDMWDRWHLNDMRSCCQHQRAMGWDTEPIDPSKPTTAYEKFDGHSMSWNLKVWAYPPLGHMTEPCPVCGYKCGTAWLLEEIPSDVIKSLESLPDTDVKPAWV